MKNCATTLTPTSCHQSWILYSTILLLLPYFPLLLLRKCVSLFSLINIVITRELHCPSQWHFMLAALCNVWHDVVKLPEANCGSHLIMSCRHTPPNCTHSYATYYLHLQAGIPYWGHVPAWTICVAIYICFSCSYLVFLCRDCMAVASYSYSVLLFCCSGWRDTRSRTLTHIVRRTCISERIDCAVEA